MRKGYRRVGVADVASALQCHIRVSNSEVGAVAPDRPRLGAISGLSVRLDSAFSTSSFTSLGHSGASPHQIIVRTPLQRHLDLNAVSTALRRVSSLKGFSRQSIAPSASIRSRNASVSCAFTK